MPGQLWTHRWHTFLGSVSYSPSFINIIKNGTANQRKKRWVTHWISFPTLGLALTNKEENDKKWEPDQGRIQQSPSFKSSLGDCYTTSQGWRTVHETLSKKGPFHREGSNVTGTRFAFTSLSFIQWFGEFVLHHYPRELAKAHEWWVKHWFTNGRPFCC